VPEVPNGALWLIVKLEIYRGDFIPGTCHGSYMVQFLPSRRLRNQDVKPLNNNEAAIVDHFLKDICSYVNRFDQLNPISESSIISEQTENCRRSRFYRYPAGWEGKLFENTSEAEQGREQWMEYLTGGARRHVNARAFCNNDKMHWCPGCLNARRLKILAIRKDRLAARLAEKEKKRYGLTTI
jgi:hypothetical protein